MVRFAFDNGYGEGTAANANNAVVEAAAATRERAGSQDGPIIRKLSAMFDDIKELFDGNKSIRSPSLIETPPVSDPVPEGKFTGSKTVTIEGVGAMTATLSAQFHDSKWCTFKVKCYAPETLQQRVNTAPQSKRLIHKLGSYSFCKYEVQFGEHITIDMQRGQNQGQMNYCCRLEDLGWHAEQQQIVVSIGTLDDLSLSTKMNSLLEELFREPITLEPGTCEEVVAFNAWIGRAAQDIQAYKETPRMNP